MANKSQFKQEHLYIQIELTTTGRPFYCGSSTGFSAWYERLHNAAAAKCWVYFRPSITEKEEDRERREDTKAEIKEKQICVFFIYILPSWVWLYYAHLHLRITMHYHIISE